MKYYGNPLYHIIATNNKANKIRINQHANPQRSFFPQTTVFFAPAVHMKDMRANQDHQSICQLVWIYGYVWIWGIPPNGNFHGKEDDIPMDLGMPKKDKKVNERNCPCQPASHWPEPAKRAPTFPGQSSIPPERPWDPAGRQQMDCHHHSHRTCWGKAPENKISDDGMCIYLGSSFMVGINIYKISSNLKTPTRHSQLQQPSQLQFPQSQPLQSIPPPPPQLHSQPESMWTTLNQGEQCFKSWVPKTYSLKEICQIFPTP